MARTKVTVQDLEQVMNLDNWLNTTDTVRKNKKLSDAWAEGNTNCAFQINNITGVERSHRGNDWNFWGDMSQMNDNKGGDFGTYLNFKEENKTIEIIVTQEPQVTDESTQIHDNRNGSGDISFEYTETETNTVTSEVTITDSVSMTIATGIEVEGFSIQISSTFDQTTASMKSESKSVEKTNKTTGTVGPGKYLEVHTIKMHGQKRYRVRIPVVMEGFVGLCSAGDGQQGHFIPYPLYDFVDQNRLTRWITFDMVVDSTTYVAKTYDAPTAQTVSKKAVKSNLAAHWQKLGIRSNFTFVPLSVKDGALPMTKVC